MVVVRFAVMNKCKVFRNVPGTIGSNQVSCSVMIISVIIIITKQLVMC